MANSETKNLPQFPQVITRMGQDFSNASTICTNELSEHSSTKFLWQANMKLKQGFHSNLTTMYTSTSSSLVNLVRKAKKLLTKAKTTTKTKNVGACYGLYRSSNVFFPFKYCGLSFV